jgi:acyl-[acyl carrier protein]--UDP-N-acetylglucosamine O-acyltransferase
MTLIHPAAIVSPNARLGNDVQVGAFSIIHENVVLGDGVIVNAFCELGVKTALGDGSPLIIGCNALIRSHSIFYESSVFGDSLVTGHRVVVREKTFAGKSFQIGTASEIQGDCTIGDYVRFQSNIFVGKTVRIGSFVRIAPYVVLTNDPTPPSEVMAGCIIEDYASVSAASTILPGVRVGRHALVAAQSCVTKDVPDRMVVAGTPARVLGLASAIKLRDGTDRPAYPWTTHFTRGFPDEVIEEWINQLRSGDD